MNKFIVFLSAATILTTEGTAQPGKFVIRGTINAPTADSVTLSWRDPAQTTKTTQPIRNNTFEFSGTVNGPVNATLYFKKTGEPTPKALSSEKIRSFFLEQGTLSVSGDPSKLRDLDIHGSKTQNEMNELTRRTASVVKAKQPFVDAYLAEKDHEKAAEIREKFGPFDEQIKTITYGFFLDHPNSFVTSSQIKFYVSNLGLDSLRQIYANFNETLKNNANGKDLAAEILKMEAGSPGKPAFAFTATDINGMALSLSHYRGRYVLLDFWASWCVPCRKGNPHLLELYARYKADGFEVIGISDDDSKPDAWRQAVADDGIGGWKHVLRGLKRTASGYDRSADINEGFGIHTLPTKILVDPSGKIIGRYGDSIGQPEKEIDNMLATIFKH